MGKGVLAAADELTKGIKRALDLAKSDLSRDVDRDVRRVSTASPDAFIFFSRGLRLAAISQWQDGIALLLQAVEIDPKFALAFKYLWRASFNAGRRADGESYMRQAAALCGRLSEKERGDLTVLFYRDYEKKPAKERAALERLWRFHPDDRFGGIQLMHFYVEREDWSRALNVAERGLPR